MSVSAQWASIQPQGMKKKRKLFAPVVEEQAARGIATQMVIAGKEQERYEEERGMQEQQFAFQQEQQAAQEEQWNKDFETQQTQWQADYDQRVQEIADQQEQWQTSYNQQKKQNRYGNILGGFSTAASILSVFDLF